MSRKKRLQNIDGLINTLTITLNQCSLSENETNLSNEAIAKLNRLRVKKGLTDKQYQHEIADIVSLILQILNINLK